jgi:hypothetical protein
MKYPQNLSKLYLESVQNSNQKSVEKYRRKISNLETKVLINSFETDTEAKLFWCNIYNGLVRESIKNEKPDLNSSIKRLYFFYTTKIDISGYNCSLQLIEHTILRKGKTSFGFGYIPRPVIQGFYRRSQPSELDNRIHFLLNCGVKSCPVVRVLNTDNYENQAEKAKNTYLSSEVEFDKNKEILYVPKIMSWYRGDFGGSKGILNTVNQAIDEDIPTSATIKYNNYDWSLDI